jgi:hypothetical protein
MGVDFFLLPRAPVKTDATKAHDWLDRVERRFAQIPRDLDPVTEARKRALADLLLKMKPNYCEFDIRHAEFDPQSDAVIDLRQEWFA